MEIKEYLSDLGIEFEEFQHPAVYTAETAKKYLANIRGLHSKNLFLREKKKKGFFYLLIVEDIKKVDLKELGNLLGHKVDFCNEAELKNILGLTPGSVSPSGLLHDKEHKVKVLIDEDVWNADFTGFHPDINTETLEINREGFRKYIKSLKNEYEVIKVPE
ncbi:MAG: prolyl-tRNA synthetase associated domain-containing protein [Nanoarchaeota archaeon]|nr:prolyl-tRNA synthetase associated domain-containing protein [Nanoarchaeota archaeon]MBU1621977.1 prolyl-tRNA synthetase associated domain-containing protein [Nanoarchaeota archaeon]MBU1974122.1 prolyl-tRNA synthetase associated domain-containing protein [Nanoarchaeota archaeon]